MGARGAKVLAPFRTRSPSTSGLHSLRLLLHPTASILCQSFPQDVRQMHTPPCIIIYITILLNRFN